MSQAIFKMQKIQKDGGSEIVWLTEQSRTAKRLQRVELIVILLYSGVRMAVLRVRKMHYKNTVAKLDSQGKNPIN